MFDPITPAKSQLQTNCGVLPNPVLQWPLDETEDKPQIENGIESPNCPFQKPSVILEELDNKHKKRNKLV